MNIRSTIKLNNFEIKKLTDKNLQEYFMIVNNDNRDEVYFCFQTGNGKVEEGWDILSKNPSPIEIEIEYEENEQSGRIFKRVKKIYADDDILV